jgi:hypothetical protein
VRRFIGQAWPVPLLVFTAACGVKEASYTLLDLDCGKAKLRFQEKVLSDFNHTQWNETTLLARGSGWVELSAGEGSPDAHQRVGAEAFSRLLPPSVGFRAFPFDEKRPRGRTWSPDGGAVTRRGWALYVDPAVVSRTEYDAVASCLASHTAEIDHAFESVPPIKDPELMKEARAHPRPASQLSSVVYSAWDGGLGRCGPRTLGARWTCGDGKGYIKTVVGRTNAVLLCAPVAPPGVVTVNGLEMELGQISEDQRTVWLVKPCTKCYAYTSLVGAGPPAKYYASCRDESGQRFTDAFQVVEDPR